VRSTNETVGINTPLVRATENGHGGWGCNSGGTASTPKTWIGTAKYHAILLLGVEVRGR